MKRRFERGYSLTEILLVLAILGVILAITIAGFSDYYRQYKLSTVTRRVSSAISLARLKAVSTNMNYTFTLDASAAPNQYQITGTNDLNGNGTVVNEPWEDVNDAGTVITDQIYDSPQTLENPIVDHFGITGTNLPNSDNVSLAMDAGTVLTIVFDGRGRVIKMEDDSNNNKDYILLQSQGYTHAIFVDNTGLVRVYKYLNPGWAEIS
jgi:prepilin-type N-terminal cleavage/methylation domain-containing protein